MLESVRIDCHVYYLASIFGDVLTDVAVSIIINHAPLLGGLGGSKRKCERENALCLLSPNAEALLPR